ncbi:MAG: methyltransferase [Hyphomonadaceae bacterium]|nr:methyltransferase [Hyphomonadaceae bacterium]
MSEPLLEIDAFIRANTRIAAPPLVPEVRMHLADDAVALWEMTEATLEKIGLPPPFWAFAWAGGQALARYVLEHPEIVRGKRVWDVGAGGGLLAIAASLAGASEAHAFDIDPFATHAARLNAALSGAAVQAWTRDVVGAPSDADVILVGDLCYERDTAARLIAWLQVANAAETLLGDPGRTYLPKSGLARLAEYDVPTIRTIEDADLKRTGIWRL